MQGGHVYCGSAPSGCSRGGPLLRRECFLFSTADVPRPVHLLQHAHHAGVPRPCAALHGMPILLSLLPQRLCLRCLQCRELQGPQHGG